MSLASTGCDSSLSRAESYKDQRRKYRREKKRVARELLSTLKDPSVIVLADWLKVRGTLKGWTKLWCVLKPGMLLLYKSSKAKVRYLASVCCFQVSRRTRSEFEPSEPTALLNKRFKQFNDSDNTGIYAGFNWLRSRY